MGKGRVRIKITDDLSKKLYKIRDELKNYFQEELAKVDHRVAELDAKIKENETEILSLKNDKSNLETQVNQLEKNYDKLKTEHDKLLEMVNETEQLVKINAMHINDMEQYTRRNNIIIYGVDDRNKHETAEKTADAVCKLIDKELKLNLDPREISRAHKI